LLTPYHSALNQIIRHIAEFPDHRGVAKIRPVALPRQQTD
jgi:hypothetical protein